MTDQQVHSLVVFFQLALLNQDLAEEAARSAYLQISAQSKAKDAQSFDILFVRNSDRIFRSYRKKLFVKQSPWKKQSSPDAVQSGKQSALIHEPHNLDMSPWRDYSKSANADEMSVMIWNHILKIDEELIAEALELSVGTVRHRLSRGLRSLSQRLEQSLPTVSQRKPWN